MRGLSVTGTAVLLVIAVAAQAQTLLDRGSYLVNGIMTCPPLPHPERPGRQSDHETTILGRVSEV